MRGCAHVGAQPQQPMSGGHAEASRCCAQWHGVGLARSHACIRGRHVLCVALSVDGALRATCVRVALWGLPPTGRASADHTVVRMDIRSMRQRISDSERRRVGMDGSG